MNARADDFLMDQDVSQLRIPPHSIEAECSVLGSLLLDNFGWDRVGDLLKAEDFYRHEHRVIFETVGALMNACKPADVVTVFAELQKAGKTDQMGGLVYLNSLAQTTHSAGSLRRYAEIVRERSVLRRLVAVSDEIASQAFNPQGKTIESMLDEAQQKVFAIGEQGAPRDEWQSSDEGVVGVLDAIQSRHDGDNDFTPTGLTDLDEKLNGGVRAGKVYVIAGRPSMGKTALAMTIAEHVATNEGQPVGFLSMEMPKEEVQERRVSMHSNVPYHKLLRPERLSQFDWSEMTKAIEMLRQTPLHVSDQTALTINQVRTKARALKRRNPKLRLLVVDYIGLMEGTDRKANRATQLGEVSRGMKSLAKELEVAILLLAQLNREVEKRPNMRPILADLRECGDIEQDADVVLFVHRPAHAKPELGPEWKAYAELILAKHRGGACGLVDAQFVGESMRFFDWQGERPTSQVRVKGGDL